MTVLHRDERKNKVLIRFTCSRDNLDVRCGFLGTVPNTGKAEGINAATKDIVNDFFSPRAQAPRSPVCGPRVDRVASGLCDGHPAWLRSFRASKQEPASKTHTQPTSKTHTQPDPTQKFGPCLTRETA